MSPSAERIEEFIGRSLKSGDVLIKAKARPYFPDDLYEIINPRTQGKNRLLKLLGIIKIYPTITVRRLTQLGPEEDIILYPIKGDLWQGVIKKENRTDLTKPNEKGIE